MKADGAQRTTPELLTVAVGATAGLARVRCRMAWYAALTSLAVAANGMRIACAIFHKRLAVNASSKRACIFSAASGVSKSCQLQFVIEGLAIALGMALSGH